MKAESILSLMRCELMVYPEWRHQSTRESGPWVGQIYRRTPIRSDLHFKKINGGGSNDVCWGGKKHLRGEWFPLFLALLALQGHQSNACCQVCVQWNLPAILPFFSWFLGQVLACSGFREKVKLWYETEGLFMLDLNNSCPSRALRAKRLRHLVLYMECTSKF